MKSLSPERQKELFNRLSSVRKKAKVVTYSAVYGVGKQKLARETGMSVREAGNLLEAYWRRNWAVKKVAEQQYTKEVAGYTWLKNPISGFWHELRYDKDRWSTTNQSSGVYIMDSWLARARLLGYNGLHQYHDETGGSVKSEDETRKALQAAIERLNNDLKLNVDFSIDIKFGTNYAEVH
jgi:DNA polymerase I-like protein with 3'-5' exonuclease and polymerase domains